MGARPRLLLMPQLTEIEWTIRLLLEEWAEVASFDAPGVGGEPPAKEFGPAAIAERGLEELRRLAWSEFVLVADEYGVIAGIRLARARPESVKALAIGHACLTNEIHGRRAPIDPEMHSVMARLIQTDYRMWARHLTQITQGAYDDDLADRYIERVPRELAEHFYGARKPPSEPLEEPLRSLEVPMLFAKHEGCILHTEEGFADAVAAFPSARTVFSAQKPSTSPEFAAAIRELCDAVGVHD